MTDDPNIHPEKKRFKRVALFILLALFFASIFIICLFIDPEEIVKSIGIGNVYLVAFVVSFFAGFSAFTTASFYSMMVAFISGGLNPYLMALVAGTSLALGDMFLFYFGRKGRDMISGKADRAINRMATYFSNRNLEKFIPLVSYIYMSFIPLPNDWLLLFLASLRYSRRNMNIIIILGDYTHAAFITILTVKGIMIFT